MFEFVKSHVVDVKKYMDSSSNKGAIIYLNPHTYNYFRHNLDLIYNVDGIRFDGLFMTAVLKFFCINVPERQSFDMTSLAPYVLRKAIEKNYRIYVCGGTDSDVKKFIEIIKTEFEGINVVGCRNGYFNNNEFSTVVEDIIDHCPDIVILGLGGKKQEIVASQLKPFIDAYIFTCGAFISQTTKEAHYYPTFINKYNLRWLYRFYKEPHTINRVFLNYPLFVFNITIDFFKYKLGLKTN